MGIYFEWDPAKAAANYRKHGISFDEAVSVFRDDRSITVYDPDHSSMAEDRFITIGASVWDRVLVVVHCDRGEGIRLISARQATPREREQYHAKSL